MGKLLLYAILVVGAFAALIRPWIGVCLAYLFILLTPQNIWWWNFQGLRPVYWILLPTIIGFFISCVRGYCNFHLIKNNRNIYFLILWLFFILSYYFGPFVNISSNYWFRSPEWTFSLINKIFVLYFIASILIDNEKKLKYSVTLIIITVIYYIYWANAQYLFYHHYGRIGGPKGLSGGGIYSDQNTFAMLFVVGLPFIYYFGWYFKKKLYRYAFWCLIPLGWHAVFLTGSRGGLLGLGTTIVLGAYRTPNKLFRAIIIPIFLIAFIWQAGPVMKQRFGTIKNYEEESSAEGRINAWKAAIKMMINHPFLGVGLSAFGPAFPYYSDKDPREAHNTFFQIAAESGILAGIVYMLIIWQNIRDIMMNSKKLSSSKKDINNSFLYHLNEALLLSIIGFTVCSLFLSLQVYEVFYFLCVLINSTTYLVTKKEVFNPINEKKQGLDS